MPAKSLFEQEAPKIGTQKCSTKCGVRGPLHAEFALNNRELVNAEEFEKECSSKRPHFTEETKGQFSLNLSVGTTVRPPGLPRRTCISQMFVFLGEGENQRKSAFGLGLSP